MFDKPYKSKTSTQLKTSDKKKLRLKFISSFPGLAVEDVNRLIALKDDISVTKAQAHKGDISHIYFVNKEPLAYSVSTTNIGEDILLPTVYLCWQYPHISLVTKFPTHKDVLRHLQRGSDLMIPGIIYEGGLTQTTFGKFDRSSPVAVTVDTTVIAVGITAYSSTDMYMLGGERGKAVFVSHVYGDHLWGQGSKMALPGRQPLTTDFVASPSDSVGSEESAFLPTGYVIVGDNSNDNSIGGISNSNTQGSVSNGAISNSYTAASISNPAASNSNMEASMSGTDDDLSYCTSTDCTSDTTEMEEQMEGIKLQQNNLSAPPEVLNSNPMDALLLHCFLKAIVQSKKKLPLPLLASTFYANHIRIAIPDDQLLNVKKTSYKKFSKFLKAMEEEKIITIKQETKDVEKISAVDYEHHKVTSFRFYKRETTVKVNPNTESQFIPPTLEEVLIVSGDTLQFFKACGRAKGDVLNVKEVRQIVTEYVKKKKWVNPETKLVTLEPPLAAAVTKPREGFIREMAWNDIINRLTSRMNPAVTISRPGFETQIKKGKISPIEMSIAKRSGNKTVTLVYNVTNFGISEQELSGKLNKMAAASSSVMKAENKPIGTIVVQVQGNATSECADLLLNTYNIPKKYIRGLELIPKKKR